MTFFSTDFPFSFRIWPEIYISESPSCDVFLGGGALLLFFEGKNAIGRGRFSLSDAVASSVKPTIRLAHS